ncbi:MAG: hypothetical protein ABI950_05315 [Solirubrobacteraceae bacterium]
MSLYRQPGRYATRTIALAAGAALVVGLVLGLILGRSTAPDPTLAEKVAGLRTALAPARQGVELVATEYPQAVRGGRVVAKTEYAAAKADVQRARAAVDAHAADLRAVGKATALQRALAELAAAVDRRADAVQVRRLGDAANAALGEATKF